VEPGYLVEWWAGEEWRSTGDRWCLCGSGDEAKRTAHQRLADGFWVRVSAMLIVFEHSPAPGGGPPRVLKAPAEVRAWVARVGEAGVREVSLLRRVAPPPVEEE